MNPDLFLFAGTCLPLPACGLSFPTLWAFQHSYNRPLDRPSHALQNLLRDHKSESCYCCLVRVMCVHVDTHTHSWGGGRGGLWTISTPLAPRFP